MDLALTFLTAFLLRDQRAAEPLLSSSLDIFKVLGKLLMKVWGDDPKGKDEVRSVSSGSGFSMEKGLRADDFGFLLTVDESVTRSYK